MVAAGAVVAAAVVAGAVVAAAVVVALVTSEKGEQNCHALSIEYMNTT